jgi:DNA-binding response OmpR family regulator
MLTTDPLRATWPATILVADDEPDARRLLRLILEPAGYVVCEAATGRDALAMVQTERPDLLILDITLPDIDGVEICRQIKNDPATHLTPVVHMTGMTTRDRRLKALAAGSDEFVGKPFDVEEMLIRVRSLLRTKHLTDHLVSAEAVMVALARTVEARDHYTEKHLRRVADRSVEVAERMGMDERDVESVRLGASSTTLARSPCPTACCTSRRSSIGPNSRSSAGTPRRAPR